MTDICLMDFCILNKYLLMTKNVKNIDLNCLFSKLTILIGYFEDCIFRVITTKYNELKV